MSRGSNSSTLPRSSLGLASRPRRKGPGARAVGSFVPMLTRKAFEKYGFSAAALLTDWAAIVGADLAGFTQPERLKWPRGADAFAALDDGQRGRSGATLVLRVDGARALDVQYRTRQIVERINGYFGYRAVAEIRLIQAPVAAPPDPCAPRPRDVLASARPPSPMPALEQVVDDGLRAALERLQRSVMRR